MTEKETCDLVYTMIKEGIETRRNGTANKHPANTLRHMLSATGWLQEDLRITLMKANPTYAQGQASYGNGLEQIESVVQ